MEIGPRMTLRLVKIEEGVNEGEVLYHAHVEKTAKEIGQLRKMASVAKWGKREGASSNKKFNFWRKKRLRHEKQVEHLTIRKMKYQAEKEGKEREVGEEEKRRLISKQREVTGDYSEDEEDGGTVRGIRFGGLRQLKAY